MIIWKILTNYLPVDFTLFHRSFFRTVQTKVSPMTSIVLQLVQMVWQKMWEEFFQVLDVVICLSTWGLHYWIKILNNCWKLNWWKYRLKVAALSKWWWWWWMMNCFCGMADLQKAFSLISSWDHCQRSSPSRISHILWAGFEPAQNLSSGLVQ